MARNGAGGRDPCIGAPFGVTGPIRQARSAGR